jgi:4-hydroxybenzoate polyprenyltransferase
MKWGAYFRLMRFHKPVGIILLWIPTACALWIANHGMPPMVLMSYFFLGTLLMRAAGCIVNDLADRNIDHKVERTRTRPLTAGEVSVVEALMLFGFLLSLALFIVLQLPSICFYQALIALGITILYPFCKRFFDAPQLILGLAFSMGIPMAFSASGLPFSAAMLGLFILNFAWILAYDTVYAMADREDDRRIGVKSTALLFEPYDRLILTVLQCLVHGLWLYLAWSLSLKPLFYIGWVVAIRCFIQQQRYINQKAYIKAFSSNASYGLLMWVAVVVSM